MAVREAGLLTRMGQIYTELGRIALLRLRQPTAEQTANMDRDEQRLGDELITAATELDAINTRRLADNTDAGTEWEYEPNREALAMEARVEPEGRWGDE